jgi:hypothetical protein
MRHHSLAAGLIILNASLKFLEIVIPSLVITAHRIPVKVTVYL